MVEATPLTGVELERGLGAEQSPPDERDWDIAQLYEADNLAQAIVLPATYVVPKRPPILNQGSTPMCVAYSCSSLRSYQDRTDAPASPTAPRWFNFDEPQFFRRIGGTSQGAYLRTAMEQQLKVGYPVVNVGDAGRHRIAAYYAVPKTVTAIKTAVKTYGQLVCAMPWWQSWMRSPEASVNYTLPRPNYRVGGHAIVIDGWDDNRKAIRLRNSWGGVWGLSGDCFLPYAYIGSIWEIWKAVDRP